MPEWITLVLIAIFSGLVWLLYNHPKEGRKLIYILFGILFIVFMGWSMFNFGVSSEYRRIIKQYHQITITEREGVDPMLFWFCCIGGFLALMLLSFFFQNLKEKSTDNVDKKSN